MQDRSYLEQFGTFLHSINIHRSEFDTDKDFPNKPEKYGAGTHVRNKDKLSVLFSQMFTISSAYAADFLYGFTHI